NRFWFTPSDPTTLGAIRIFCGVLILYTHLAYTYDLRAFVARDAWDEHELVTKIRVEQPYLPYPRDWNLPGYREEMQKKFRELNDRDSTRDEAYRKKLKEYEDYWDCHPEQAYRVGNWVWSIWFHVTDPSAVLAVHI